MSKIVGLDLSPTHCGITVMDVDNYKKVEMKFFSVKDMTEKFNLVEMVVNYLSGIKDIEIAGIEGYKMSFGKYIPQNIYQIGEVSGIVKYILCNTYSIPVLIIVPSKLNSLVGIKKRDKKGTIRYCKEILGIDIVQEVGKLKGGFDKVYGDLADSCVLSYIIWMGMNSAYDTNLKDWYEMYFKSKVRMKSYLFSKFECSDNILYIERVNGFMMKIVGDNYGR